MYADIMSASDMPRYEDQWKRLGFRTALIRDITGNVLQSGDDALGSRLHALEAPLKGRPGMGMAGGARHAESCGYGHRQKSIHNCSSGERCLRHQRGA